MKLIKDANPVMKNSTRNVNADKFTDSKLKKIYNIYGFKDFKDFKIPQHFIFKKISC